MLKESKQGAKWAQEPVWAPPETERGGDRSEGQPAEQNTVT